MSHGAGAWPLVCCPKLGNLGRDSSVSGCVLGAMGLKRAQESSCGGVKQIQTYSVKDLR